MNKKKLEPEFPRGVEVITGCLIRNSASQIFLAQSPKWGDSWVVPGGHVEPGETILDAAVRETFEETGLRAKPLKIIDFGEMIHPSSFHRKAHFVYFNCLLETDQEAVELEERELRNFKWLTPQEALKMKLGGETRSLIRKYLEFSNSR